MLEVVHVQRRRNHLPLQHLPDFRVQGVERKVGLRVSGFGSRVQDLGLRVKGFRVEDLAQGLGLRNEGAEMQACGPRTLGFTHHAHVRALFAHVHAPHLLDLHILAIARARQLLQLSLRVERASASALTCRKRFRASGRLKN